MSTQDEGSTAYEVLSVILPSCLLVFITTTSCTVFFNFIGTGPVRRYLLEFTLIVLPLVLNVTVLVPYMIEEFCFCMFLCLCLLYTASFNTSKGVPHNAIQTGNKQFISNTRSIINLFTAIAILAVDFKVFPRRFRKRLKYGYSLMDVGVGLFVFGNGIVAPELRRCTHSLHKTVKDVIPIVVLGLGRYFATTLIEYKVAVSEYGLHWNFFITLAVTRILSSLILNFIHVKYSFLSGVSLLAAHESCLQLGLAEYVFSNAKRDNFFSANREGIVSSLGFVGLYFLSVSIGNLLDVRGYNISNDNIKLRLISRLTFCTIALFSLTFYLESYFHLSRRLANSVYCLWTLSIGVLMTTLFYVSELIQSAIYKKYQLENAIYVPFILDAINYNGLVFFLTSNILTGLVNMTFNTLLIDSVISIVILIVYICICCAFVCLLYTKNIKLKLNDKTV